VQSYACVAASQDIATRMREVLALFERQPKLSFVDAGQCDVLTRELNKDPCIDVHIAVEVLCQR
jgi:hypothetical protein